FFNKRILSDLRVGAQYMAESRHLFMEFHLCLWLPLANRLDYVLWDDGRCLRKKLAARKNLQKHA
ncbi:MAG: hypothetical protein Q8L24_01335, partial [bacterium]|nr:hypothetical protein [bacterium]